jgi:hypothetical protein
MKLGTPFFTILTAVFMLVSIGIILGDMNTTYYETGIQNSTILNKFADTNNYIDNMNKSFSAIQSSANEIGNEGGWKVWENAVAIVQALITTIGQIIQSLLWSGELATTMGSGLGIPAQLISIGSIAIIGGIVIMIVKFAHSGQS